MTAPISPDAMEITRDETNVTMIFREDAGASCAVVLRRSQFGAYIARLMREIEEDRVVPIDQASLMPGRDIAVQGWQVHRHTNGARRLVLFVELENPARVVTIPLTMSAEETADLIGQLGA